MEMKKSEFQMPLHYPRYSKKDYEAMGEWELDRLLAQYGLPNDQADLSAKREFAMGAFLWPDDFQDPAADSICGFKQDTVSSTPFGFKFMGLVHFFYGLLRNVVH